MLYTGDHGFNTHPGKVRKNNEDSISAKPEIGLWLVADGIGGHREGALASSIAKETINQHISSGNSLFDAIEAAHMAIMQAAELAEDAKGMGSTIVALKLDGFDFEVAWLGDSRAYLWNGQLEQITEDHSYVRTLLDQGAISEEEAVNHPSSHLITRCLGIDEEQTGIKIDTKRGQFKRGEEILLCSDGLTDELSDVEIGAILSKTTNAQDRVDELISTAIHNGGSDNISAVLLSAPTAAPVPNSEVKSVNWVNKLKLVSIGVLLAVILLFILF